LTYQPSIFYTGPALSSACDLWGTPRDLFDALDAEFGFEVDVCALPNNAKCERFFTPEDDGLTQDWRGVCWMNPPYGRTIGQWVEKAYRSSLAGATVVCLLPARTDTAWWHDLCMKGEIRFLRGRVRFERERETGVRAVSAAPFPSAIVIFKGNP
jgi:phage N-6-adenine-methyltransferase